VLTFGAGLFVGTNGSEADAVPTISAAPYHVASLSSALRQPRIQLFGPLAVAPVTTGSLPPLVAVEPITQTPEPFGIGTSRPPSGGLAQKKMAQRQQ
jgi:hypothetical protein